VDQQQPAADGSEGRLVYLVENLATLHAASGMPWIAGRFEFLGEKAIGAALSVLALPDETGAYRAVASASPRVVTAQSLWDALGIDNLASNSAAAAVFGEAESHARAFRHPVRELFPEARYAGPEDAIVAPVSFNRELIGVGMFVAEPGEMTEAMATILASHAAVAIHQLRERDDARRLHSMDPRLWVPDENFLLAQLRREVARSRRYGRELGLALLRFESEEAVREQFGDFYTNHLMRRIGSQLLAKLRDSDVVGALDRGYAVLHTETSLAGTQLSSERLRDSVLQMMAQRFPEIAEPRLSIRVVAYPESGSTVEDLVQLLADPTASDNAIAA
jgi:two-component system, cell cycle response regulator